MECTRCNDEGVIDTGNNDLPCDCAAGDKAVFNVAGVGTVVGSELKRSQGVGFGSFMRAMHQPGQTEERSVDTIQYNAYDLNSINPSGSPGRPPGGLRLKTALAAQFPGEMDGPNADLIMGVCIGLGRFLCAKNKAYGDAALNPLRVFSRASAEEQIRVRIDDKISRLSRGSAAGEDAVVDLMGYLVLLLAKREEG